MYIQPKIQAALILVCGSFSVGQDVATKDNSRLNSPTSTVRRSSPVLPTWRDTLLRNDVSLLPASTGVRYFPTQKDLSVLGDRDYPRIAGSQEQGPDALAQNATDIFPYRSTNGDFYSRNADSFRGVNRVLGVFAPQQAITYEPEIFPTMALSLDANIPNFITRTFEPSKAHVKAGPLAFDLLWVGAGMLWSDYKGANQFQSKDGWIEYIDLALRGYLRLTDSITLSWAANLMYLPGSNQLAFRTLNSGYPQLMTSLFYQKSVGGVDITFTDRFSARPGVDIFVGANENGFDRAGRYQFGYYGQANQTGFYQSQNVFFNNQASLQATAMLGSTDWRMWTNYVHNDYWRTFDFTNYQFRDLLRVAAGYEGNSIPFSPIISYQAMTQNAYNSFWHQIQLQGSGRITENVRVQASIGYLWTTGTRPSRNTFLWSTGIIHQFSRNGTHGLQVGQQLIADSNSPETQLANYYRYYITYQLAQRIQAAAYIQYASGDRLTSAYQNANGKIDGYIVGGSLQYQPFDFTRVLISSAFQRSDGNLGFSRMDHWIHRLQLNQQLASRLTLQSTYQYETMNSQMGFSEHLFTIGIRRYF